MHNHDIYKQLRMWRQRVIDTLNEIPEDLLEIIPEGFNNNIKWNAGHLVSAYDGIVMRTINEKAICPSEFSLFFGKDTSPQDWNEEVPSMETITCMLKKQLNILEDKTKHRLDESIAAPFLGMEKVSELVLYGITHEALHLGHIISLTKAARQQAKV